MMMRKTFYYNFLPTKAEEEALAARNAQFVVTRTLVEIRDWLSNSGRVEKTGPWQIRKVITRNEVGSGEIVLSHEEMFEHVFKYWNIEWAEHVIQGKKWGVKLFDYTDENMPKAFQGCYVKVGGNVDTYAVGLMEVFRNRVVNPGDEIGLFWDMRPSSFAFCFKLLRRGNSH